MEELPLLSKPAGRHRRRHPPGHRTGPATTGQPQRLHRLPRLRHQPHAHRPTSHRRRQLPRQPRGDHAVPQTRRGTPAARLENSHEHQPQTGPRSRQARAVAPEVLENPARLPPRSQHSPPLRDIAYLQIFDVERFAPEPASQSAYADHLYWTFLPPPAGEDFRLELNASVMSSRQLGSTGQIAVVVDGAPAVSVDTETWLVP
jgi:hypothetical protein